MIAEYDFYTTTYLGSTISEDDYDYLAERASDYLADYVDRITALDSEAATLALQKCACAIAEALNDNVKSTKNGSKMSSESISGYYSVSYSVTDDAAFTHKINGLINLYLGRWLRLTGMLGAIKITI